MYKYTDTRLVFNLEPGRGPQISEKRYSNSKSWSHFSSPAFYSTAEKLTVSGGPFRVFDSPKLRKKRNHIKCVTIQNQVKVRFKQQKEEFHISFLIKCGPWSLKVTCVARHAEGVVFKSGTECVCAGNSACKLKDGTIILLQSFLFYHDRSKNNVKRNQGV